MNGRDYVAMQRLSTKANETLAEMGERCDRVPAASLNWLLEQDLIRPAVDEYDAAWRDLGRPVEEAE